MSTQLALTDDIQPRRFRRHTVLHLRGPFQKPTKTEPDGEVLPLRYEDVRVPRNIFEVPYPIPEDKPRVHVEHNSHACGISKHFWACPNAARCNAPFKMPCAACEERVQASYRPGFYAVAR